MNFGNVISRNALIFKSKIAISFKNKKISWEILDQRVNQTANALKGCGVSKADVVAIVSENCLEMIDIVFAAAKLGAISFPVNPRLSPDTVKQLLTISDAKVAIFSENILPVVEQVKDDVRVCWIIIGNKSGDIATYDEFINGYPSGEPGIDVDGDDTVMLFGTGGTTGSPKLVALTHKASIANAMNMICDYGFNSTDVGLQALPLYHVVFNTLLLPFMFVGATVVLTDLSDPDDILSKVEGEKVTIFAIVPPMLLNRFEPFVPEHDLSSIRYFLTAAASFPAELKKKTLAFFKNTCIGYSYGLTEMGGGNVTILRPDHQFIKDGSIGLVTRNLDWRVVNENGLDVGPGEIGELILRGPTMMKEYYHNEKETLETIREGWLYTGDMVRQDEEGFIYLIDRRKNMIKSGGENVYAKLVEDYLLNLEGVADIAVVGIPDAVWGEKVVAVIVARQGSYLSEEEVVTYCKAGLARFEVPKTIEFVAELPRNPSGKVLKHVLVDRILKKKQ